MSQSTSGIFNQSIQRNTLANQVVDRIVKLLTGGQLKSGDKLPSELELMESLGVSRPVLREALSSLETMEVITRKTRTGTFINDKIGTRPFSVMLSLSIDNLPAIIEARMSLELGLITIAAEKITAQQLDRLEETIDYIANSGDNNYGEADKEFHRIIALSAENPIVEGMVDSLIIAHDKVNLLIQIRERELTVQHHRAIYNALVKRDPLDAFVQMYNHLHYVRAKVLQTVSSS